MKQQIAIFRFTLSQNQTIGPARLQALWTQACQTPHVSVGREEGVSGGRPTYSLYAQQRLENLPLVEQRLRHLFDQAKLHASLIPLHTS